MKTILFFMIDFYQKIASFVIKNLLGVNKFCRYSPTCSEYAKISVQKHGIIKGGYFSILRVLSCQPFFNKSSTFFHGVLNSRGKNNNNLCSESSILRTQTEGLRGFQKMLDK